MKRLAIFFLLSAFILQSAGCGLLHSFDRDLVQQIDAWLENHEYAKALDTLGYVNKNHPQYELLQRKKIEIEQTAKKYEQQQLKAIQTHVEKQEWYLAEQLLNESREKLPESGALQSADQQFVKLRAVYLKNLHCQLTLYKAEWLVKNTDIQQALARTDPEDKAARRTLDEHKKEAVYVSQQLTVCGTEAMNMGDLELAEQALLLAEELQPSPALHKTISEIQQQLATRHKRATLVFSEQARKILANAKVKMRDGNLKEAAVLYNQIPEKDKSHAQVIVFKRELNTRIKDNIAQGTELGRKLYSQGEVKQALAIWNNIRELDPNNQSLINYIKRAERVLDKLEKLQEEGTTIKPPAPKDPKS